MKYFEKKNFKVFYLSPIRSGDVVLDSFNRIGNLGKFEYFDGEGFFSYLGFILKTNFKISKEIFSNRKLIDYVHFSDMESVILGGPLCKAIGIKFFYNIHDNFFQRYELSNALGLFLKVIESFYIWLSAVCIVPENFRKTAYPKFVQGKIKVIRNIPELKLSTKRMPFTGNELRLYYGGWVSPGRDIGLYYDLAFFLMNSGYRVSFSLCGWGSKEYIGDLKNQFDGIGASFIYHGQLEHHQAIEILKESDISIAFYNPTKKINLLAASNKIPEIIGSNTILITNNQTEISKQISEYGISLQFGKNISEVFPDLISLIEDKEKLSKFIKRSSKYFNSNFNYASQIEEMDRIFSGYV